jgi:quinoprotein glucose dehydrogenase
MLGWAIAIVAPARLLRLHAEGAPATWGEWRSYGSDLASSKYSALAQIDRSNFSRLRIAWRWKSADGFLSKRTVSGAEWWGAAPSILEELLKENPHRWRYQLGVPVQPPIGNMKVTPIMANGRLFVNTALSMAVALDARTGEMVWIQNPKSYEAGTSAMNMQFNVRGVAYWSDGRESRILWGTSDARLLCADAMSGRPCAGFGRDGQVDLYAGLPRGSRADRDYLNAMLLSVTSPPLVVGRTVVVGSAVSDHRITKVSVPGWVRAFDVMTGAQKWVFKTVPEAGEFGADTWKNDAWAYSGNTNVWTTMSADAELGYVYLPTSTPTNDYYGGHRLGTACSPRASCASRRRRDGVSGTSRRFVTASGTTTSRRRRILSTSPSTAAESRPSRR